MAAAGNPGGGIEKPSNTPDEAFTRYLDGRKPGLLNRENGFRWQWLPWIGVSVLIWAGAIFGVGRLFGWW